MPSLTLPTSYPLPESSTRQPLQAPQADAGEEEDASPGEDAAAIAAATQGERRTGVPAATPPPSGLDGSPPAAEPTVLAAIAEAESEERVSGALAAAPAPPGHSGAPTDLDAIVAAGSDECAPDSSFPLSGQNGGPPKQG